MSLRKFRLKTLRDKQELTNDELKKEITKIKRSTKGAESRSKPKKKKK